MDDTHDKSFKGYTIPEKGKYSFGNVTLELDMRPYTQSELVEMAFDAGQESERERLKKLWPSGFEIWEHSENQRGPVSCAAWIYDRLFGDGK
jgi:hypothetical protein